AASARSTTCTGSDGCRGHGLSACAAILGQARVEDLERNAPEDIRKDWKTLNTAISGLSGALKEAGVSADDFDNGEPPEGVSAAEAKKIADAATQVSSTKTQEASVRVQQQARDVCHTSLTL
ncbi:hypothetical protein, partial [Nocardioides sp. NPDC006273]|uniref:hypothetical protein n=1 Tax=Nocardioides sp. NPDC006273 TaxID=3155598 RepID=UPI0033BD7D24